MTFETNKNLGGVGALLIFVSAFISAVPGVGGYSGILTLVGAILVLAALKGFADYYKEMGIFNNALYSLITAILGVILVVVIFIFAFAGLLTALDVTIQNPQDLAQLGTVLANFDWQANMGVLLSFAGTIFLGLVVLFVFVLITAIFLRKSLNLTAARSGVGMFHTTGLLLLIGAILTIIIIGIFLIWISVLLLAIAFFSMRPSPQMPPSTAPTQPPTPV